MGLEEVLENIKNNTDKEVEEIEKETNAKVEKILQEAKEEAKIISKREREREKTDIQQIITRKLSKARIEGKTIYNNALNRKVEEAIEEIKGKLEEYRKSSTYQKLIIKLVGFATANLGENCIIFVSKKDITYLKKKLPSLNFKEDSSIIGGIRAISSNNEMEIDYTLGNIVEDIKDKIASKVLDKIRDK